jgi:hypothetical protein
MHIRQGQAEIEDVQWNVGSGTLTVRATRPQGYSGNIYLHIPKGFAFKDPTGLWLAKEVKEGCLTVRYPVDFKAGATLEKSFVLVPSASLLAPPAK